MSKIRGNRVERNWQTKHKRYVFEVRSPWPTSPPPLLALGGF